MKFLQIALGAFVIIANAVPFDKNCLYLSGVTVGNPNINDRSLTNKIQLSKGESNSNMRIDSFLTCTDDFGEVTGVQMRIRDPSDPEEENSVDLTMLGYEGNDCERLTLKGGVNKVEASVSQLPSKSFGLNSIRYVADPNQKTYGSFLRPFASTWEFDPLQPVIGLYGLENPLEKSVVQLGFITLDIACQEEFDSRWDGEIVNEILIKSEQEDNTMLFLLIIGVAVLVLITVIIVIVCVVRSKEGEKGSKTDNSSELENTPAKEGINLVEN